jgi:hypothetical protein
MSTTSPRRGDTDECDPPTDVMRALDGATTAGAPATMQLHHLHGLLTALGPLRASYAAAAVDRLRALPLDARRAVLPHVLEEHPGLAREPRVRALAEEVLLDVEATIDRPDVVRWLARISGVRARSAQEALDRVEQALAALSSALVEVGSDHSRTLGCDDPPVMPSDVVVVLRTALEPPETSGAGPTPLVRWASELRARAAALVGAARDAADEVLASEGPAAIAARACISSWWPRPFRDAALWSYALRESESPARREIRAQTFDAALEHAYFAHLATERG